MRRLTALKYAFVSAFGALGGWFAQRSLRPKRRFTLTEGYQAADLMLYAKDHFACAKAVFESGKPLWLDSAGYLSHLSVELALKALLLDRKGEFPGTHDLRQLYKRAKKLGFTLSSESQKALREINEMGELRYPNPAAPTTIGHEHLPRIEKLFAEIVAHRPDLAEDRHRKTPEGYVSKGGRTLMAKPIEPGD